MFRDEYLWASILALREGCKGWENRCKSRAPKRSHDLSWYIGYSIGKEV